MGSDVIKGAGILVALIGVVVVILGQWTIGAILLFLGIIGYVISSNLGKN
jgi:hypothetical protein